MALKTNPKKPAPPIDRNFADAPEPAVAGATSWDFTYAELFAGIGGFRVALDSLGGKCVFASEWNKQSQDTYEKNHGERPQGDITKIDPNDIPDHDILTGGFPCQTFSVAGVAKLSSLGKDHGLRDPTKGTMFGYTKEIIAAKRPKMFFLENVKNIRHHDGGKTFTTIVEHLKGLDYHVVTGVQTSVWWVPQHRERMFFIGFDNQQFDPTKITTFAFPPPPEGIVPPKFGSIFDADLDERERARLTDRQWEYLQEYVKRPRKGAKDGRGFHYDMNTPDSVARTLLACGSGGSALLIEDPPGKNPRRPTPREFARLMGFPDTFVVPKSITLAQRQFGNAVVPPLIRHVAEAMLRLAATVGPNPNPLPLSAIVNVPVIPPDKPRKKERRADKVDMPMGGLAVLESDEPVKNRPKCSWDALGLVKS